VATVTPISPRDPQDVRAVTDRTRQAVAVAEAVEAERARLRAWLHDTVLQQLEFLASGGYADAPDAVHLMAVAGDAATCLRAFVEDAAESGTLVERLRAVIADEQLCSTHEIRLVLGDLDGTVSGQESAELVAAVREALVNVRKHARATRATVVLHVLEGQATVTVRDDGTGFDPKRSRRGTGLRRSIIGRLALAGGSATVDSTPGGGTRLTLRLRTGAAHGVVAA
jgi:signal transduction histidine kinase